VRAAILENVYEQEVGTVSIITDAEEVAKKFKAISGERKGQNETIEVRTSRFVLTIFFKINTLLTVVLGFCDSPHGISVYE